MRHKCGIKKLGKPTALRIAMLRSLAISLITHGRIETTVARAKALRGFVEPLITLGKDGSIAARRNAMSKLPNKDAVNKLFAEVAPLFKERNGGYTRVLKTGIRPGDGAMNAIIELVEKPAAAADTNA